MDIKGNKVYLTIDDPLCQELTDMLKRVMKNAKVNFKSIITYIESNNLLSDTEIYIYTKEWGIINRYNNWGNQNEN